MVGINWTKWANYFYAAHEWSQKNLPEVKNFTVSKKNRLQSTNWREPHRKKTTTETWFSKRFPLYKQNTFSFSFFFLVIKVPFFFFSISGSGSTSDTNWPSSLIFPSDSLPAWNTNKPVKPARWHLCSKCINTWGFLKPELEPDSSFS